MRSELKEGRAAHAAPRRGAAPGSGHRITNQRFECIRITNGFDRPRQTSGGTLFLKRDTDEKFFLYCDRKDDYHSDAKEGDVYVVTGVYNENTHTDHGTNNIFKTTRTELTKEDCFFHDKTVLYSIKKPIGGQRYETHEQDFYRRR